MFRFLRTIFSLKGARKIVPPIYDPWAGIHGTYLEPLQHTFVAIAMDHLQPLVGGYVDTHFNNDNCSVEFCDKDGRVFIEVFVRGEACCPYLCTVKFFTPLANENLPEVMKDCLQRALPSSCKIELLDAEQTEEKIA